jgi:hypothetical protein
VELDLSAYEGKDVILAARELTTPNSYQRLARLIMTSPMAGQNALAIGVMLEHYAALPSLRELHLKGSPDLVTSVREVLKRVSPVQKRVNDRTGAVISVLRGTRTVVGEGEKETEIEVQVFMS